MATEQLDVAEATSDDANGHTGPAANPWASLPAGHEKVETFADPRREVVRIIRDRLERVLQPVEDDPVWHGVNVITARDLEAATSLELPAASALSAAVRTPAYVYVSAVCPNCSIATKVTLELEAELKIVRTGRKLKLAAKAGVLPHQCGQLVIDELGPSRPREWTQVELPIDEVEANAGDVDLGEGAPNALDEEAVDDAPDPVVGAGEPDDDDDVRPTGEVNVDELRGAADRDALDDIPF